MSKRLAAIVLLAIQTLRTNPLHIFLSTLGLIIGVGALVAILSLGDGLEQYGRNQISTTTSLETIIVTPKTRDWIDGVSVARDTVAVLQVDDAEAMAASLSDSADVVLKRRANVAVRLPDGAERTGAYLEALAPVVLNMSWVEVTAGRFFDEADEHHEKPVVVLAEALAQRLAGDNAVETLVGQTIAIDTLTAEVIGVVAAPGQLVLGPYAPWTARVPKAGPPELLVRVHQVERVPVVKTHLESWLDTHTDGGSAAFTLVTNEARVAQVQRGVRLFKLIMGLITGIAVLVGGIGVMNVLLISVTERTREIGIRKATGARRRDIVWQFLTESIVISIMGSLLGLLLGLAVVAIAVPILKQVAEAPFDVAFSWASLGVIVLVAVAVGLGFGTYPAWRASRLSPVDAIRHE